MNACSTLLTVSGGGPGRGARGAGLAAHAAVAFAPPASPSRGFQPPRPWLQNGCLLVLVGTQRYGPLPAVAHQCTAIAAPALVRGRRPQALRSPSRKHSRGALLLSCAALCAFAADLEWKLTYVGSAESEKYDQVGARVA